MILQKSIRPRSAAGRATNDTRLTAASTATFSTMQVLQPEPIVIAPRPVSATTPVLQSISNKTTVASAGRSKSNRSTSSTATTATTSSSSSPHSEQHTFLQEQNSRIFLTDVRNTNAPPALPLPLPPPSTPVKDHSSEGTGVAAATLGHRSPEGRENTSTATGASPREQKNNLEGRILQVQETQNKMRAELEQYLQDVRARTDEDGTALVEFPDSFDVESDEATTRESSWRKFISERVLSHPDEELDRKTQKKM